MRIFGAGILSSRGETLFALDDPSPHRVAFDLERIMRTNYVIDDFQRVYFVIDSFERLLAACADDFTDLYDRLMPLPNIAAGDLAPQDRVISRGTMAYFNAKA